ncbi:MAG TPA: MBL fold metallo-hydrolase [Polyangia bacterium]|nr:MBL fold metallo-hydrolase [Polyangia bacterium]
MARAENRLPHNADGDFFVDDRCIDCDTCRSLAPAVFSRAADFEQSFVEHQPASDDQRQRALMALVSCPTAAIGTVSKIDVRPGIDAFPTPVADEVFYCGFASEASFGAASYLIRRPEGNVLVDSPRASPPLLERLRALGGVRTMFLTHRDDVADHAVFRRELGCERVLHRADMSPGTADVERPLDGHDPVALAPDLLAIPVPGHTPGSMALLYREKFLFSGDHLWWSPGRARLHASRCVNWYSWDDQLRSLHRLLDFQFSWILPGHGRRFAAPSPEVMRDELARVIAALRS